MRRCYRSILMLVSVTLCPFPMAAQDRWLEVPGPVGARVFLDTTDVRQPNGFFAVVLRWHYDNSAHHYTIERADLDCANGLVRTWYRETIQREFTDPPGRIVSVQRWEPPSPEWFLYGLGSLGRLALDGACRTIEGMPAVIGVRSR